METVAIIQARMGSSRLPGKVMLPLGDEYVLAYDIHRANAAETINQTIVATTQAKQDDVVAEQAVREGANILRGAEFDLLERMYEAADQADADVVVRLTGDCPLLSPQVIDATVQQLHDTEATYASTTMERTFPRGVGAEAFRFEAFRRVVDLAEEPYEREHVTPYFYEHPDKFELERVVSQDVFDEEQYYDRTDLRLTLDEPDDYKLFQQLFDTLDMMVDVRQAIDYIDKHDLHELNQHVEQRSAQDVDERA